MRIWILCAIMMAGVGVCPGETAATTAKNGETVQGSGTATSQTRSLGCFNVLHLQTPLNVTVKRGAGEKVQCVITGDDNIVPLIVTEVDTEELMIKAKESYQSKTGLKVDIVIPRQREFDALLQSSGNISLEDVAEEQLLVRLEGSGNITATGKVKKVEADLSGSGNIQLSSVQAETAEVTLGGSGNIEVHATETLDVKLAGSGSIMYGGSPKTVNQSKTGSGNIIKK